MADELHVGVIGCGAIGQEHVQRLTNKLQGATVVGVTDVVPEAAKRAAEVAGGARIFADANALIADSGVDAVVVTTPGFAHKDSVLAAIKAGKPVFCEKPLTFTSTDSREIVGAEKASGKQLVQVGFMRRYDRGYLQVKERLDSGALGKPLLLKCTHRAQSVDDAYTTEMAVTDTLIHEIDCLHWLLGDEWEEVQVIQGAVTRHAHAGLIDPQLMIMRTKGEVTAIVEVFVNCHFGYDINCEVVCEDGTISLPSPSYPSIRKDGVISTEIEQDWKRRFADAYDTELQDWIDSTLEGEVNGPTAWDGYVAGLTAEALVAAQASGAKEPVTAKEPVNA